MPDRRDERDEYVMISPVASDRQWVFDESPDHLWDRISEVENYRSWWPWLREFDPGEGLVETASWYCEVVPPLPYVVRFNIEFHRVREAQSVETRIVGDVRGSAVLTLRGLPGGGTSARLVSTLSPMNPVLRAVGTLARPMVKWGHDWVLDQGRRQFIEHGSFDEKPRE